MSESPVEAQNEFGRVANRDAATIERWRRKGFDLRYGPRWYLHYDGRPPLDDEHSYVWSVAGQCWQRDDWDDDDDRSMTAPPNDAGGPS